MQNQNPSALILLMTQANLSEFEHECLSDLSHKQAKSIIKHLSGFLTDAPSFAQQIIAQNEAAKAAKAPTSPNPSVPTPSIPLKGEDAKPAPLDGKKLVPVPEVKETIK